MNERLLTQLFAKSIYCVKYMTMITRFWTINERKNNATQKSTVLAFSPRF